MWKNKLTVAALALASLTALLSGCNPEPKTNGGGGTVTPPVEFKAVAPAASADSIYTYI